MVFLVMELEINFGFSTSCKHRHFSPLSSLKGGSGGDGFSV